MPPERPSPGQSARSPSCAPATSTARNFVDHPGGSLINDRAIDAAIQERVLGGNEVRTFRTSLNTLGDGFVEAIDSNNMRRQRQPASRRRMRGTVHPGARQRAPATDARRPVSAGRTSTRASSRSPADAYLNEMGITSRAAADREHLERQLGRGVRRRA